MTNPKHYKLWKLFWYAIALVTYYPIAQSGHGLEGLVLFVAAMVIQFLTEPTND